MPSELEIKATILYKLKRRGKWDASHTSIDILKKGFPKHLRGDVKDIVQDLIKEGLLLQKPTGYGLEVSLNILRKEEIDNIIKDVLGINGA
jgi:hypothetical protein